MESIRAGHLNLLQKIRCGLQMLLRQVQIDGGVREIGMAEQKLDGSQIRACFQQVRRVSMTIISHAE